VPDESTVKVTLIRDILDDSSEFQVVLTIAERNEVITVKVRPAEAITIDELQVAVKNARWTKGNSSRRERDFW
jgi:hypothetical protein